MHYLASTRRVDVMPISLNMQEIAKAQTSDKTTEAIYINVFEI